MNHPAGMGNITVFCSINICHQCCVAVSHLQVPCPEIVDRMTKTFYLLTVMFFPLDSVILFKIPLVVFPHIYYGCIPFSLLPLVIS